MCWPPPPSLSPFCPPHTLPYAFQCSFGMSGLYSQGWTALGPAPAYHAQWTQTYVTALQVIDGWMDGMDARR